MSYAVLQHLEFVSETDFHFFLRIQCPKHLYYEKKDHVLQVWSHFVWSYSCLSKHKFSKVAFESLCLRLTLGFFSWIPPPYLIHYIAYPFHCWTIDRLVWLIEELHCESITTDYHWQTLLNMVMLSDGIMYSIIILRPID